MALLKGKPVQLTATGQVDEEVPQDIPRGRGKRPKIRALVDGVESTSRYETMTRASTLGGELDDKFRVHRWEIRTVVLGMSRRPELVRKAAAVPGNEDQKDKEELQEIGELAHDAGGGNKGSISGTALHRLSEQLDQGVDLSHLDSQTLEALRVYRRLLGTVRIVASETFVVCDVLNAAGTFDRVVELLVDVEVKMPDEETGELRVVDTLPAGTRIVVDLKTNKAAKYFGATYLVQQAVYGHGVPYTHAGGRADWPDGRAPSRRWALILHVPIESLDDAGFYWVDLNLGLELGHLANGLREERKHAAAVGFAPAELAPGHAATDVRVGLLEQIRNAESVAAIGALFEANEAAWDTDCGNMADARARELTLAAPAPAAAEVVPPTLPELIAAALDEAQIDALYQANRDQWGPAENEAARLRWAELDAATAVAS